MVMLGPEAPDLWGFDLGSLVSPLLSAGSICREFEEIYSQRRTCDDEHAVGLSIGQVE